MKPILIHCHIFYPQFWPELKRCLQNIKHGPTRLYVTMVEKHKDIIADIGKSFPDANIQIVDNRGYDIGPFIHVLNQVDLDDYSYVVKLHTKRDVDYTFCGLTGGKWRETLLKPYQSRERFNAVLSVFEKEPKVGMQADYRVIVFHDIHDKEAKEGAKRFLQQKKWPLLKYGFVAGTVFIVRANILKSIQQLHLDMSDFVSSGQDKSQHRAQAAHMFERLLGYIVYKQGFEIKDAFTPKAQQNWHRFYYRFVNPIVRFLFQKKITKSQKLIVKICKIPVYRRKI